MKKLSRPYFETKVVKVGKEKKREKYIKKQVIEGKLYGYFLDKNFNNVLCLEEIKKEKPKGNWVNGENLDAIKFPCFCSFDNQGKKCYGKIDKGYICEVDKDVYQISDITKQVDGSFTTGQMYSVIYTADTLKDLIHYHNVHILKGKIIIWEEEK